MNYKGKEINCTQQELDEFINSIPIEFSVRDFGEQYNNVTIDNPTSVEDAKYYVLKINGGTMLQTHVPGEAGFMAVTSENVQQIIDEQTTQAIDALVIAKFKGVN